MELVNQGGGRHKSYIRCREIWLLLYEWQTVAVVEGQYMDSWQRVGDFLDTNAVNGNLRKGREDGISERHSEVTHDMVR